MKNILNLTLIVLFLVSCKGCYKFKILAGLMKEVTGKNDNINEKYDLLLKESKLLFPITHHIQIYPPWNQEEKIV